MARAKAAPSGNGAGFVVEEWPIDRPVPYDRNPRVLTEAAIRKVAASIRDYGWQQAIVVDEDGVVVVGHTRLEAAKLLGLKTVPIKVIRGLAPEKVRAYRIADNRVAEETSWNDELLSVELAELSAFDLDMGSIGFDEAELVRLLQFEPAAPEEPKVTPEQAEKTLAERFGVPPFSVLDQRQGYWQERKRAWVALGIESDLGRGDNLLKRSASEEAFLKRDGDYKDPSKYNGGLMFSSHTAADPGFYDKKGAKEKELGRKLSTDEFLRDHYEPVDSGVTRGTSIFDPVLAELCYRWFVPPGGAILDPFAGGSVRGIVAARLGYAYHGIDLRQEQCDANKEQIDRIGDVHGSAKWYTGDSANMAKMLPKKQKFDFVFSCPPYGDLEVYSDDPADLSTMADHDFRLVYATIIERAVDRLKEDRFCAFVVGDFRDKGGFYRNFVSFTIKCFEDAGARLYNEAILVNSVGSLPIRVGRQFSVSRKLGKTHQNVLVFCKGDPAKATEAVGEVDFGEIAAPGGAPAAPAELTPVEKHGPFG